MVESAGGAVESRLTVEVVGPADEELQELLRHLSTELSDLPLVVTTVSRDVAAPPGAKGIPTELTELLSIRMIFSREYVQKLLATVHHWVARQRGATVKVTLEGDTVELTGASSDQVERLVKLFVDRHAQPR
jgi:hypothetical protein